MRTINLRVFQYTDEDGNIVGFSPTVLVTSKNELESKVGQQLWQQSVNGVMLPNYYTHDEIVTMMSTSKYLWTSYELRQAPSWLIVSDRLSSFKIGELLA